MKVLISGGGTGGHIFPALSIANAIRRARPDTEILFVGAQGRMEMQRVPAAGYRIMGLPVAGFDRKRIWRNFGVLIKLAKSMRMAKRIIRNFQPDIAIGVGGYASGPMLKAAQKHGIPTLLQEQNSYAGVTNKLLAKKAKKICVAYEGMDRFFPWDSIMLTGNPVRDTLGKITLTQQEAKQKLGFDPNRPLLVVVGGSLGARTINQAMENLVNNAMPEGLQILWQTGKYYFSQYKDLVHNDVIITEFITNMDVAYRAADFMVARAGACTISEIQNLGKASILIPSPNVAEDHQRKNAEALVKKGAAEMILDAEAIEKLPAKVQELLSEEEKRKSLSDNALAMALPGADDKIAQTALKIIEQR